MPDSVIHLSATIIGEADSILSRTRASLAPAQPVSHPWQDRSARHTRRREI